MKLDRNSGVGKYAIVKLRNVHALEPADKAAASEAIDLLRRLGCLDYGEQKTAEEFFVIRLRDRWARHALTAYAWAATEYDRAYGADVLELAQRSGPSSPFCKVPD